MSPTVSIIIAIFNSEQWLRRCLRSALSQTLESIELLLIDDGSTDSSPAICDEYAAIAPQIRVFHRQNAGVSATRQFGIDQAKGEYLSFLDSDDYVDPQAYEKMYRSAKKEDADLVICDWYSVYGNVMYPESLKLKTWDKEHLLHALVLDQPAYQWAFLFRRSLFQNLSVGFPMERISFGEDTLLLTDLLLSAIKNNYGLSVCHIPENLYYYDRSVNPGSLMKRSKADMNAIRLNLWTKIGAQLDSRPMKKAINDRLVTYLFAAVWNHYCDNDSFRKQYSHLLPDIQEYATAGIKKLFVCRSLKGGMDGIMKLKWLAAPVILQERMAQRRQDRNAIHVPTYLSVL